MNRIEHIIANHRNREGPLLPILHDIQAEFSYISEDAMRAVATGLNITRAEVFGVVSFYHDFRQSPATTPILKICRAEACQARGIEALVADAEAASEGAVTLEATYCLGLCSVGPAAMTPDGKVHARLDGPALKRLIGETR
ncbi:MAG: NAD(P)H-dependent oxidoreductase subunit E [Hyphomonas sp.]